MLRRAGVLGTRHLRHANECWLPKNVRTASAEEFMKTTVVYVFPLAGAGHYLDLAIRFVAGYHQYPPGVEHETVIVCNGSPVTDEVRFLFGAMPNCKFLVHDNSGYDVGAYQHAARSNPSDLMVFFGASTYLKGPGWLKRMADAFQKHGRGLYGVMGNRGVAHVGVAPHIRTTGFWMPTELMNQYPMRVERSDQRYPFEHGSNCLTSWIYRKGLMAWVVTWSGEYQQAQWDSIPNGFHHGDQSDMLAGDKNSEPPYYPVP